MSSKRVVVIGGGVAGLTAAHELVDRGFDVTVYERRRVLGGKARSYPVSLRDPKGGDVPGVNVPGEHGFRFFPGFYRHLDDTMTRIAAPAAYLKKGRRTVFDCLSPIGEELLAVAGHRPITIKASVPLTVKDIRSALRIPAALGDCGLTDGDLATFSDKLWQVATSCPERRNEEYEGIGWRDFVESKDRSDEYYWYLASGMTRALVAARARYASTKTMGNIALRFFGVALDVGQTTDRVLCGPTNEVWIDPWRNCITKPGGSPDGKTKGAGRIEPGRMVTGIGLTDRRVTHVMVERTIEDGDERRGEPVRMEADYFVFALPVEALSELVKKTPELQEHPQFKNVMTIADAEGRDQCLRKMTGLQIYCKSPLRLGADQPLNKGHQLLLDSPWGLTSIDQGQFWDRMPAGVGDILSIDVSSWDMKGLGAGRAFDCTDLEVFREVCAQLRAGLGDGLLDDDNIIGWHLDSSPERLLVNRVGSWALRPTAATPYENLTLAGDFVQTMTDLACMEGANEAARAAVNAILAREGVPEKEHCPVWDAHESAALRPFQEVDRARYKLGLPWSGGFEVGKWLVRGAHAAAAAADPLGSGGAEPTTPGSRAHRVPKSEWDDAIPQIPVVALTRGEIEKKLAKYDRYAQPGRSDPMFKRWRLYQRKEAPKYLVPLHIYDADTVIVYGKATEFEYLERLSDPERTGYHPVFCEINGRRVGFAELWLVRYNDTTMGPCAEVAINFVVSKDKDRPPYRWRSPYSAMVPMMDPSNRLFTPEVIVQEPPGAPGCIEYGNDLFGMNKLCGNVSIEAGPVYTFSCSQLETRARDGSLRPCREEVPFSGAVNMTASRLDAATAGIELARVMGPLAAARNWRQIQEGAEISGGLVTLDFRKSREEPSSPVEIKAAYKFAPTICELDPRVTSLQFGTSEFGQILARMGFKEAIAAHEPHLKSVLYTDDCPTPND